MKLNWITDIISTFGETILLNDKPITAYVKNIKNNEYKVSKYLNSFIIKNIQIRGIVTEDDLFTINEDTYRIFNIKTLKNKGQIAYHDIMLYKDDLTKLINIYEGDSETTSSYPKLRKILYKDLKARVLTVLPFETAQLLNLMIKPSPFAISRPSTLAFVIFYTEGLYPGLVITYKNLAYKVNKIENINDADKLLKLYVTNMVMPNDNIPEGDTEEIDKEEPEF